MLGLEVVASAAGLGAVEDNLGRVSSTPSWDRRRRTSLSLGMLWWDWWCLSHACCRGARLQWWRECERGVRLSRGAVSFSSARSRSRIPLTLDGEFESDGLNERWNCELGSEWFSGELGLDGGLCESYGRPLAKSCSSASRFLGHTSGGMTDSSRHERQLLAAASGRDASPAARRTEGEARPSASPPRLVSWYSSVAAWQDAICGENKETLVLFRKQRRSFCLANKESHS